MPESHDKKDDKVESFDDKAAALSEQQEKAQKKLDSLNREIDDVRSQLKSLKRLIRQMNVENLRVSTRKPSLKGGKKAEFLDEVKRSRDEARKRKLKKS